MRSWFRKHLVRLTNILSSSYFALIIHTHILSHQHYTYISIPPNNNSCLHRSMFNGILSHNKSLLWHQRNLRNKGTKCNEGTKRSKCTRYNNGTKGNECTLLRQHIRASIRELRWLHPYLAGDGKCNGRDYNTIECRWDGGDCDQFNCDYLGCKADDPSLLGMVNVKKVITPKNVDGMKVTVINSI